ncbi:hypothetical protein GCM10010518_47100 [Kitasatospora cinereorecta]
MWGECLNPLSGAAGMGEGHVEVRTCAGAGSFVRIGPDPAGRARSGRGAPRVNGEDRAGI